jgi:hypothetical protein
MEMMVTVMNGGGLLFNREVRLVVMLSGTGGCC